MTRTRSQINIRITDALMTELRTTTALLGVSVTDLVISAIERRLAELHRLPNPVKHQRRSNSSYGPRPKQTQE